MFVTLPRALAIPAVLVVLLAVAGAWVDGSRSSSAGSAPPTSVVARVPASTVAPAGPAGPRTSCAAVVHIGDSTSVGLMAPNYLEDPATRIDARYAAVGVTDFRSEISGGRSIVERLEGQENAEEVAERLRATGFDGCWVLALGTTDAANMAAGAPLAADARIARLMTVIGDDPVLWVNTKTLVPDGAWAAPEMVRWNEALEVAADSSPNITVYDWAGIVQDVWFQDDGIHYTSAGYARARPPHRRSAGGGVPGHLTPAAPARSGRPAPSSSTDVDGTSWSRVPDSLSHPLVRVAPIADHEVLESFSPAVRAWFAASFPEPTGAQIHGWPPIAAGQHTLICAPTGSGKTLAAFLSAIDSLVTSPAPQDRGRRTRVLYISPLRALAFDVEKNLRAPLAGIALAAERIGEVVHQPEVAMRTGDTASRDRQRLVRHPPDLLITTPESLYLMLTSSAAETLAGVETVIVDEIHALAPTKRGAHLALSLERLEELTATTPQRIGLSATQRPLEEVARFLGGWSAPGAARPVTIVDVGISKPLEIEVVIPVEDMADIARAEGRDDDGPAPAMGPRRGSIWPSIYPRILDQVLQHRSTIIFCNARRQAERLAAKLNELAEERGIGVDPEGVRCEELVARPPWLARASSASSSRTPSSAATCAPSSPPAAWSWASTWGPSTS